MNLQPFTCKNEKTCSRFKHSFISIKACCSVQNKSPLILLLPLPLTCGLLLPPFSVSAKLKSHLYIIIQCLCEWVTLRCFVEDRFLDVAITKWSNSVSDIHVSCLFFIKPLLKLRNQSVQSEPEQ